MADAAPSRAVVAFVQRAFALAMPAAAVVIMEASQFRFECSTETWVCIAFAAPLSLSVGLATARPLVKSGIGRIGRGIFWAIVAVLALAGAPAYLLPHICR